MSNWSRPWLQRFHRNFFVIYVVTIVFNFWAALNAILGSDSWFDLSILKYVNYVDHGWWGLAYLGVGTIMLLGLFRPNFNLARIGLALGLFLACARFLLIVLAVWLERDVGGANTLTNMLMVVGVYVSQLLEPPVNPSTMK